MARIEWVAHRLENWALWCVRQGGFASQSVLERGPITGTIDEVRLPVIELEAAETNEAVEHLKLGHGYLYQTLRLYYLRDLGVTETARVMRRAVSTVHAQLGQADRLLASWFHERDEVRRRATEVGVRRLTAEESQALLQQLAEERRQLEARRPPPFVGPPRPPVRRNRPKLKLGGV